MVMTMNKSMPEQLDPIKFESILDALEDAKLICYGKSDITEGIDSAILLARRKFFKSYKELIFGYWRIFDANLWYQDEYLNDHAFVSQCWNLCVRKYHNAYYAVQIRNLDNLWQGVLTTECPDDYPTHSLPDNVISAKYPEIAMVKVILAKKAEEEKSDG